MIDHTNLEDYDDPTLYDLENHAFEPDGPFYLQLAQKVGGPVLDLGCGTGRITIPLAQHGVDMTGVDIVPAMLDRARQKAGDLPIQWVEADIRNFHLGRKFKLVFAPGGVFEHLLERKEQESMLACIHDHLHKEGLCVFAILFPRPELFTNTLEEQDWFSYTNKNGQVVRVSGTDFYDPVQQLKHETAYRRWINEEGEAVVRRARLTLRFIFPKEMATLLYYNGFKVLYQYGDWDSSPLTDQSRVMIYVCKKV